MTGSPPARTGPPGDEGIARRVADQAARRPDAPAVVDGADRLSYAELQRRAQQLAAYLQYAGVGRDSLVGICLPRSAALVVAELAVLAAGGAYVPVDPDDPPTRISLMLSEAEVTVVVTTEELAARLHGPGLRPVCLDRDRAAIAGAPAGPVGTWASASDLAYVMHTSGSTGRPKGICVTQRAVLSLVTGTDYLQIDAGDRVACASNCAFDASTFEIWGALLNGACLVVVPRAVVLSAADFAELLGEQAITVLFVTTALFKLLVAYSAAVFASVTHVLVGGETMDPHWMRLVLAAGPPGRLVHVYGPTENTTFSCWYLVREVRPDATAVPIGHPVAGAEVHLLDRDRRPVAVGEPGEIYVGGDGLARGYLHQPELTAECFVAHPLRPGGGQRLFRTGDLGRAGDDGALEFLGRLDFQVKLNGFRVEPGEVEAVLNQHPGVLDSVVTTVRDGAGDQRLVAYVVPERDSGEQAQRRRVAHWRDLYDDVIYRDVATGPAAPADPTFNISGWVSSYTGAPLSVAEMREQVDQTTERILTRRPQRVLEIGCGTGLLLFPLAPRCRHYVGTDISATALGYVRDRSRAAGVPVELWPRAADDFSDVEPGSFDTVVLNSVVQHFPDAGYLQRVLAGAARAVGDGGTIFVGDVRSLPLAPALYAAVQLEQAPEWWPAARLRRSVAARARQEQELLLDPGYFPAVARLLPGVPGVSVQLKRGRHHNELTQFRYDVVLEVGARPAPPATACWVDWSEVGTLDGLGSRLRGARTRTGVRAVPNARLLAAATAARLLDASSSSVTAGALRADVARQVAGAGIDPEDVWRLGERLGWTVEIGWSASGGPAAVDVVCSPPGDREPRTEAPPGRSTDLSTLANDPLTATSGHRLVPHLRRRLREALPDHMVPSAIVPLDRLPLTANGKVDRAALPTQWSPPEPEQAHVSPRSDLERMVAAVWEEVLDTAPVGVDDNFFDLGGTSIKAAQVTSELRRLCDPTLTVLRLFERPTVQLLAASLGEPAAAPRPASADPSRTRGELRRARKQDAQVRR